MYAALQLAVLAGFAGSVRWGRTPDWGYLAFAVSLLTAGVADWVLTAGSGQHGSAAARA